MRFDRFLVPPVRLVAVVDVIPVPARTSLLARPLPDLAGGMVIVFTAVVAAPEAAAPEAATIAAAAEAASEYAAKTAGIAPIGVDAPVSRASVVAGTVLVVTVFTVYRVVGFAAAYVTAFELPVEHVAFAIGGRPMVPMRPRLDALQLFQHLGGRVDERLERALDRCWGRRPVQLVCDLEEFTLERVHQPDRVQHSPVVQLVFEWSRPPERVSRREWPDVGEDRLV